MKPPLKRVVWAVLSSMAIAASLVFYVYRGTARIVIFHTNDIHGWIMPHGQGGQAEGGFAALSSYLNRSPKGYLLIDSGDFLRGTPEADLSGGDAAIECMNALKYTASALGDGDYDLGEKNLERLSRIAKFPFLAANIFDLETQERVPYAQPYLIREVDGVSVGVVGVTTSRIGQLTMPENVKGLYFRREAEALRNAVDQLKARGVRVIVVAAHVGLEDRDSPRVEGEKYLAAQVPGLNLILGGHTHRGLDQPFRDRKTGTLIVHNQSELKTVTKTTLRVWRKSGKTFMYSCELVPLAVKRTGEDPVVQAIIEGYHKKIGEPFDRVIGRALVAMDRKGLETLLGGWEADVLRWYSKSDFAFVNAGHLRADLPQGPLTARDIYHANPFENRIVTMELTGAQVRDILEYSVSGAPGMIQLSGLRVVYDRARPGGSRVFGVTVNGRPLDPEKTYTVGTNDFLASGGDGFLTFKQGRKVKTSSVTMRRLYTEFVKSYSPIFTRLDDRVSVK